MYKDRNYSEEDFVNHFNEFYNETVEIYGDDVDSAYNDFVTIMEDEYGVMDSVKKGGRYLKDKWNRNVGNEDSRMVKWIERTGDKIKKSGYNMGSHRAFSDDYSVMDKVRKAGKGIANSWNRNVGANDSRMVKWIERTGNKVHGQGGLGPHRAFSDQYSLGDKLKSAGKGIAKSWNKNVGAKDSRMVKWIERTGEKVHGQGGLGSHRAFSDNYSYTGKGLKAGSVAGAATGAVLAGATGAVAGRITAGLVNKFGSEGKALKALEIKNLKGELTDAEYLAMKDLRKKASNRKVNYTLGAGVTGAVGGGLAGLATGAAVGGAVGLGVDASKAVGEAVTKRK